MEYISKTITIRELINLISNKRLNLKPPYQRNFIWTLTDQKLLIDSIHKKYPLPSFFILDKKNDTYEMVDGQQRANTIYKYYNNEFSDSNKKYYNDINKDEFLNYQLVVIEITKENFSEGESIEEFFSLVNKRGVHLNPSEINQAQYHDSNFLSIVNKIMDYQPLINLDIFSDKTKLRMNDRSLIEELVAYLKYGITDKRNAVEDMFNETIPEEEQNTLYNQCISIINILEELNKKYPISSTRYKQRNDFYTLFCFINKHRNEELEVLQYMYKTLVYISNHKFIYPSNEQCEPFKTYAINCVSQSNSKKAREARLDFFESLLWNTTAEGNDIIKEILTYIYQIECVDIKLIKIRNFYLFDLNHIEWKQL